MHPQSISALKNTVLALEEETKTKFGHITSSQAAASNEEFNHVEKMHEFSAEEVNALTTVSEEYKTTMKGFARCW